MIIVRTHSSVLVNSTAVLNCAHQYASSPHKMVSIKFLTYCTVDSRPGGLALMSTYTITGNMSSAPGGSPQRANWSSPIRTLQHVTTQPTLPRGDYMNIVMDH